MTGVFRFELNEQVFEIEEGSVVFERLTAAGHVGTPIDDEPAVEPKKGRGRKATAPADEAPATTSDDDADPDADALDASSF